VTTTDNKNILLLGSTGQVGTALLKIFPQWLKNQPEKFTLQAERIDLTDPATIRQRLKEIKPQIIINAAAYTAVDQAEKEVELANKVNAAAPQILAEEAALLGASLIHYSTDYVFDGSGNLPRKENAPTGPLNVYGLSKLRGEQAIQATKTAHLIFRTSWVFSATGVNFVKTMLRLGMERDSLKIVSDQIGAPTSADFLAKMTLKAVSQAAKTSFAAYSGIYHVCCDDDTSWYGFAQEIFRLAKQKGGALKIKEILPITSEEFPTAARRPKNSRLDCQKFKDVFSAEFSNWKKELKAVMADL
jgi:dTDP-4-dehydrorhamnose reductase